MSYESPCHSASTCHLHRHATRLPVELIGVLAFTLAAAAGAGSTQIVPVDPRFRVVNELEPPPGVTQAVGDLAFSFDGTTAYFISSSETTGSAVWSATVLRDLAGAVVGFEDPALEFEEEDMDTGLTVAPDSATLFFRLSHAIGQRPPGGPAESYPIDYGPYGGMAFLPPGSANAGNLVGVSYSGRSLYLHTVTSDQDGTYSIGQDTLYADLDFTGPGDVEVATAGPLEGWMLVAAYGSTSPVVTFPLDSATGLPQQGTSPVSIPFVTGPDPVLAWGLAIDPVTDNIWIVVFAGSGPSLVQIERAALFADGFESGDTSAWSSTAGAIR